MSGAELVAVLGIGASVIQVVDACSKVCSRIQAFRNQKGFHDIAVQLSLLSSDLQALSASDVDNESAKSLLPVLEGCRNQLDALEGLIQALIPPPRSSKLRHAWNGVRSVKKDPKIREILRNLADYKSTINLHLTTRLSQRSEDDTRPKTPPSKQSIFDVTAQKISHFVGRSQDLEQIENAIDTSNVNPAVVVLTAIGGQGKTQTALEFCHRSASKYAGIFWVDATAEFCTVRNFERIAARLSMPNLSTADYPQKVDFVKETLRNWTEPWLLVFDNYDDPISFKNIKSYFPSSTSNNNKNAILITSRHPICDRLGKCVKLDGMTESDACKLLCSRCLNTTPCSQEVEDAKAIVASLGYLALAIDQAAAYISYQQLPLSSFLKYYDRRKCEILQYIPESLWEYRSRGGTDDKGGNMSAFTTWELSFRQIMQMTTIEERHLIEEFITQAAYFDPTNIKETIFQNYANWDFLASPPRWKRLFVTDGKWDSFRYRDIVAILLRLSLIQAIKSDKNELHELRFSIHPLIKDWLQVRATAENRYENIAQSIAMTAYSVHLVNSGSNLSMDTRQGLLGTMDASLKNAEIYLTTEDTKSRYSGLREGFLVDFAHFYGRHCRFPEAKKLLSDSLNFARKEFGEQDKRTLLLTNNLAALYLEAKQDDVAERLLRAIIYIEKDEVWSLHKYSVYALVNLAHLFQERSSFQLALLLYHTAWAGINKTLIKNNKLDRKMAILIINNTGELLLRAMETHYAEGSFLAALYLLDDPFVSDTVTKLHICSNLALLYKIDEQPEKAEDLYLRVIRERRQLFGASHSATLEACCELADLYLHTDRPAAAEEYFTLGEASPERRAQAIRSSESQLTSLHRDTTGLLPYSYAPLPFPAFKEEDTDGAPPPSKQKMHPEFLHAHIGWQAGSDVLSFTTTTPHLSDVGDVHELNEHITKVESQLFDHFSQSLKSVSEGELEVSIEEIFGKVS